MQSKPHCSLFFFSFRLFVYLVSFEAFAFEGHIVPDPFSTHYPNWNLLLNTKWIEVSFEYKRCSQHTHTHSHSYMSLFRSVTNRIRYFNFRHFPLPFGNPEFRWLPCYYEYKCVVEMKLNAILCNTMNVFTSTSPLGWTISICVDSFVHFYSTKSTNIGSAFMKHAFPLIKYQQTIFDIKLNVFFTCKLNIENSFSQCLRYRRI